MPILLFYFFFFPSNPLISFPRYGHVSFLNLAPLFTTTLTTRVMPTKSSHSGYMVVVRSVRLLSCFGSDEQKYIQLSFIVTFKDLAGGKILKALYKSLSGLPSKISLNYKIVIIRYLFHHLLLSYKEKCPKSFKDKPPSPESWYLFLIGLNLPTCKIHLLDFQNFKCFTKFTPIFQSYYSKFSKLHPRLQPSLSLPRPALLASPFCHLALPTSVLS